jgi:hypothetical protein
MWMLPEVTVEMDSVKPCYSVQVASNCEASVTLNTCAISWKCVEKVFLFVGISEINNCKN